MTATPDDQEVASRLATAYERLDESEELMEVLRLTIDKASGNLASIRSILKREEDDRG